MEAGFRREGGQTGLANTMSSELSKNKKKKGLEWDLNDWRWDGNLFLATPSSNAVAAPSGCGSRELGRSEDGIDLSVADKRRRVSPVDNHGECSNAAIANGDHDRVVGRRGQSSREGRHANATGAYSTSAPYCQVDGCHADLRDSRDYHKRHKVCEVHTKSTVVRIKSIEHRFCQQCSRFHLLPEFDEGKKSCRSRLAKHNGRRRKAPAQAGAAGNTSSENQSLTNTLLLLLKQLSGQDPGSSSEQSNGPNFLVNLLKNLAAIAGTQAYQDMLKNANSASISSNDANYVVNGFTNEPTRSPIPVGTESSAVKQHVQNFDLNDAYVEEDESRTDKIVFKLFGKEPKDFPVDLRAQMLNWLSHYPSDMESHIRPGCVILTIYLRLPNWMWDKLKVNPAPWIENLISISTDGFWETGWLYTRLQDRLALSCNGRLMLVSPWQPLIGDKHQILCVTPIATACSSTANFSVKGFNIVQPTTKLLCIFGGEYLIQEATQMLHEDTMMQQGPQCLTFSCSFPSMSGRGFIEVEDYDQSSLSFPIVVAEESVCSEIRMLEDKLNLIAFGDILEGREDLMASRDQALNFLQEIGWFLQRSHKRATTDAPQYCTESFPVARFRWLLSFAIDQEWCSVVKKLLDTLFQGNIDVDVRSPFEFVLGEGLVFTAVNKRAKRLVEFLLRYTTNSALVARGAVSPVRFLFTPDITGSSNITPLHIAASMSDGAGVLDALTDDPQQLGIKAWKHARDTTGYTPEDYAQKRGHISYIQMVENKINSRLPKAHVSVSMTISPSTTDISEKHAGRSKSTNQTTLDIEKSQRSDKRPPSCRQCVQLQHIAYHPRPNRFLSNRPAVLSLVAIGAVCVCVGLIMQSPPTVGVGMTGPFLWSSLNYGPI